MNPEDFTEQAHEIQAKTRELRVELGRLRDERERQRLGEIRDGLTQVVADARGRAEELGGTEPRRF